MSAVILDLPSRVARMRPAGASPIEALVDTDFAEQLAISVVVPTYKRPVLLRRCLQALIEQDIDADRYEIVVCDDGPDETTREIMRTMEQARGATGVKRPRLIYVPVTETQGPAAARNRGWQIACGAIVAFTDDDTIPARNWLRRGLAAMRTGAVACAGRIAMDVPLRPTDYQRDAGRLAYAEFATANAFVRRDALEILGGFDERFIAAWREDSDLHFALMSVGRIERAPDAVVRHPVRPQPWGVSLKQQRKIVFDALLYKKHPHLYRRRIRSSPRLDYYAIVIAFIVGLACAVAGCAPEATVALGAWAALTGRLCATRMEGLPPTASNIAEMLATSAAIPFLATFWRMVGAMRYRVWFW